VARTKVLPHYNETSLQQAVLRRSIYTNMPLAKNPNVPPQPGSRQGALIGLQIFFIVIALVIYGLRVYTRRIILRSLGNDDYVMGVAVVRPLLSSIPA
jgi:hypothetical protein